MKMRNALLTCVATALFTWPAAAQTRDTAKTPIGTGSISGVVMTDATPSRPVRRAFVVLGGGAALKIPTTAITDDNGAFSFRELPVGAFTLVASRVAYVPTAYGAKTQGRGSGVPISVGPGQHVTGLTLKMLKGSVITGTLRDSFGRPAADVELILMVVQNTNGRRKMTPLLQSNRTDGRGEYRVYGLPPGEYVVRAQPQPRLGAGDLRPTTAAEVEWARLAAAAQGTAPPEPPPTGRPVTSAPTYYPGVSDVAGATPITLGPAEERVGVDFATQLVPVAAISGRVIGPDGLPPRNPQATLQLAQTAGSSIIDQLIGMGMGLASVRVGADGRLSGSGIAPGKYKLVVRGAPGGGEAPRTLPASPLMPAMPAAVSSMLGQAMGTSTLWASEDLTIDGNDINGIEMRLQAGVTVSGTMVFEGEDPQSPVDAARVGVSLSPASREAGGPLAMLTGMLQSSNGRVTKERTFSVDGVAPDAYRASFQAPGAMPQMFGGGAGTGGWVVKSAMLNGKDLADASLDVRDSDISGIVVTFTRAQTEISGRVQDAAGRGIGGFPIVVFTTDRSLWYSGSRRVISAKPSSDGTYKVSGLRPGEYYVSALTELDPNDLYDPTFLEELMATSFKLTLAEGEKKVQDLKLGSGAS